MKKSIYLNAIETIAFSSAIVTILVAFFNKSFITFITGHEIEYFMYFTILNIIIIILRSLPKNKIKLKITDTVNLNILYNDIFQQNGIIIIPVNEYFDTLVDEKIISSNTIHGQFIKQVFGGDEANLINQITQSIIKTKHKINNTRTVGNKLKYPLGTVAKVEKNGKIYYLVALTKFNKNNRAKITKEEYQIILTKLLNYVEQFSQGNSINIPLIGAGHSGVKLPKQKLLEFLVMSIQLNDNLTLINEVNIILHKSLKKEINLNSIEYLYNIMED